MNSLGLKAKQRKSKYKSYKGEVRKIAGNLLKRKINNGRERVFGV